MNNLSILKHSRVLENRDQKCVNETNSKNKNPEFCYAYSGFNGLRNNNYWDSNVSGWLDKKKQLQLIKNMFRIT